MVRAPCCDKMGLKKGPWSAEEDQVLTSHIQKFGHGNWRALPKQAGLLRCGKSCRLRWMNYLRPDIKRGSFTREEEDTIIQLHETLGNKWSAIAARLPGRTDNEIKNVWHTHLKKRLKEKQQGITLDKKKISPVVNKCNSRLYTGRHDKVSQNSASPTSIMSPQESSSGLSAISDDTNVNIKDEIIESSTESFPQIDESFWSDDAALADSSSMAKESQEILDDSIFCIAPYLQFSGGFPSTSVDGSQLRNTINAINVTDSGSCNSSSMDEGMDFWFDILVNPDGLPELPEF